MRGYVWLVMLVLSLASACGDDTTAVTDASAPGRDLAAAGRDLAPPTDAAAPRDAIAVASDAAPADQSVADGALPADAAVPVDSAVDLAAPPDLLPSLLVQPAAYVVPLGRSQIFVAEGATAWRVLETGGGTIDANGNYTAPTTPGVYHVMATGGGESGFATVTVADFQVSLLAGAPGGPGNLDGTGAASRFDLPSGAVADSRGDVYIADGASFAIRKLTPATGVVTTIAGGTRGTDDGVGASAQFDRPEGLALDETNGVLYVTEYLHGTIRSIDLATATVTTIVGTPDVFGTQDGVGASATLYRPRGIAYDGAGTLWFADSGYCLIRTVDVASRYVTTISGVGAQCTSVDNAVGASARFAHPAGVAMGAGVLYVAENTTNTLRSIATTSPYGTATIAGSAGMSGSTDGTGAAARFNGPTHLALDASAGMLYVADSGNNLIRGVSLGSATVTTLAGQTASGHADGTGAAASFSNPIGLAVSGGALIVADNRNSLVRSVDRASGVVTTIAGAVPQPGHDDGALAASTFTAPIALAADGAGRLFVGESGQLRIVDLGGGVVSTLAGSTPGAADGTGTAALLGAPYGLTWDASASLLYFADEGDNVIRVATVPGGQVTTPYGDITNPTGGYTDMPGTAARFYQPEGVALLGGKLYVADSGNHVIRAIDITTSAVTTFAGDGTSGAADGVGTGAELSAPTAIVSDGVGLLFVADGVNATIRQIDVATGNVTTLAGSPGSTGTSDGVGAAASFGAVSVGLAWDGAGTLYVSDTLNGTVRRLYVPTGAVSTFVGLPSSRGVRVGSEVSASLSWPSGIALPRAGTLMVTNLDENAIVSVVQQ